MGFAVYHTQKGKGSGGGLGSHIDRTEGESNSYKTADPLMKEMNIKFALSNDYQKMSIPDAVKHRIENGKTKGRGVRKDAVKYISHILTGSHEDMKEIFKDKSKANNWIDENKKFMDKEFGEENIIRFEVHLDEKTPHIHCVSVPITSDGRLSAKERIGDRIVLQQRQNSYAEAMEQFGLERGLRDTGVKHEDVSEYYKRIERSKEMVSEEVLEPSKTFFSGYKDKDIGNLVNDLKSTKIELFEEKRKLKNNQKELIRLYKNQKILVSKNNSLEKVLKSPEKLKSILVDLNMQKEEKKEQKRDKGLDFGMSR
jgi:hypothetical protein